VNNRNKISQVANDPFEAYAHPPFSPVHNLIAFQRYQSSFFRYTTVIKDINKNCQIEIPIELYGSVSWSPDGQKLVFSGLEEHYIVNLTEFIGPTFKEIGSICP
jgi:hypothetical protein